MTLIAAIVTKDAFVIAADKRMMKRGGHSDDVMKLIKVGERAVGSAYIGVRHMDRAGVVQYDVYDIIEKHFAASPFAPDSLAALETLLKTKFLEYRKAFGVTGLPAAVGQAVFKCIFYSREGDTVRFNHRVFQCRGDGSLHSVGFNKECTWGGAELYGGERYADQLTTGRSDAFATLRSDQQIQSLVARSKEQPIGVVTTPEAKAFCARLIQETHDKAVEARFPAVAISRTFDIAVVNADGVHFGA